MKSKTGIAVFTLLFLAVMLLPLAAIAQDGAGKPQEPMGNLLVILATDDLASADAAIRIAEVAARRGHQVTLLLRVRAIQMALKDTDYKIGDTTMQDQLAKFMAAGSKVFVGGSCMKLQNIPPEKLITGVKVGTPDVVMGMIFDENTKIICQQTGAKPAVEPTSNRPTGLSHLRPAGRPHDLGFHTFPGSVQPEPRPGQRAPSASERPVQLIDKKTIWELYWMLRQTAAGGPGNCGRLGPGPGSETWRSGQQQLLMWSPPCRLG